MGHRNTKSMLYQKLIEHLSDNTSILQNQRLREYDYTSATVQYPLLSELECIQQNIFDKHLTFKFQFQELRSIVKRIIYFFKIFIF